MSLTPTERTVLEIASRSYGRAWGLKADRIRVELNMSPTEFHVRLNAMLDDPRVEAASPVVVHRLQRVRCSRPPRLSADRSRL